MEEKGFVITEENVKDYVRDIARWIKTQVEDSGANGVVLGMSSGVDCSTVARLCKEASIDTHLIIMPYGNSMNKSKSYECAMELINKFDFSYHVFDIKPAVDCLQISKDSGLVNELNSQNLAMTHANIRPRIRMTYLYQYAALNNLLVIGTGNLSERTIGYFTKWGDGACDINPIANLTKKEVYILAKYLQVPTSIINKKPSAELWEGQCDEDEIGITYEKIDNFILNGTSGNEQDDVLIKSKQIKSEHKNRPIPMFCPND